MKRYGLVLADNGSPWFFQGEQNAGWPPGLIERAQAHPGLGVRGRRHLPPAWCSSTSAATR